MVHVPILPGYLVHVRCECGRTVTQLFPIRVSRFLLLEID